jgi:hypothetical protein
MPDDHFDGHGSREILVSRLDRVVVGDRGTLGGLTQFAIDLDIHSVIPRRRRRDHQKVRVVGSVVPHAMTFRRRHFK